MNEKKNLSSKDFEKLMINCLEAWENVERVEIVVKDSEFEGIDVSTVKSNVKFTKANIKEIYTTLFLIDENESKNEQSN